MTAWHTTPPPTDRWIILFGVISTGDVPPPRLCCVARWNPATLCWMGEGRWPVADSPEDDLIIYGWSDLLPRPETPVRIPSADSVDVYLPGVIQ